MPVQFFSEEIDFALNDPSSYALWLEKIIQSAKKRTGDLNYIFCNDEYLLAINKEYLGHNYYTDIVTFDHSENEKEIEGDIYISIDRVKENASAESVGFENELSRVLVHGLLHLFGYDDQTEEEKKAMREKEDACISLQEK